METPAGEDEVILLPHRAAFWPARHTLLVADLHLGKCAAFRVSGIPVPHGVIEESLNRLSEAIACTGAARVLVLGDLLHAPAGLTDAMLECVAAWRAACPAAIAVVPGNHDRSLQRAAECWRIDVLPELYEEGPFAFAHQPVRRPGSFVWCGHLHPAVPIDRGRMAPKLPCFHLSPGVGVLPAFTRFAAGGMLRRGPRDRLYVIADDAVMPV